MIYFLYGENRDKSRAKLHELSESLAKKRPDAMFFKIDGEVWSRDNLDELIAGQGLFSQKYIVVLDHVLENEIANEEVLGKIKEIDESENIFIFLEGMVTKDLIKKIEKVATKVQEFVNKEGKKVEKKFNVFALTDLLGRKDKKNLWIQYQKALFAGVEPEEVHNILNWQIKSMLIAKTSPNGQSSELKPFVYSKSLIFANNFSDDELKNLSSKIISIYHESRRGSDFDTTFEKFILEL